MIININYTGLSDGTVTTYDIYTPHTSSGELVLVDMSPSQPTPVLNNNIDILVPIPLEVNKQYYVAVTRNSIKTIYGPVSYVYNSVYNPINRYVNNFIEDTIATYHNKPIPNVAILQVLDTSIQNLTEDDYFVTSLTKITSAQAGVLELLDRQLLSINSQQNLSVPDSDVTVVQSLSINFATSQVLQVLEYQFSSLG
jgi:hypothetical protein